jgi:hypothetical protein
MACRLAAVPKHRVAGRQVTAELALLFGRALGQSPEYWLNLQAAYDLAKARKTTGRQLKKVEAVAEHLRPLDRVRVVERQMAAVCCLGNSDRNNAPNKTFFVV